MAFGFELLEFLFTNIFLEICNFETATYIFVDGDKGRNTKTLFCNSMST